MSATEVLVAVPFISLGGEAGNSTFGLRSASDTVKIADAITAGINSEGGVACRKLRVLKYEVNPINPVDQQQKCQQIIDAKPFAVLDSGAYLSPASRQCFLDAKIPFQGGGNVTEAQGAAAYPYLYTYWASIDRSVRNWVLEEAARGSFAAQKGFQKLGLLLTECYPDVNRQLLDHLRKVGVGDAQISVFTLSGCQSISPPAELSAAVAQHRSAGASHVYLAGNAANSPQYVRQADGIGWKPTYMTSDYGQETSVTVAPNWPDGFDGAIAITSVRAGERNSGIVAPWVTRCNEWLKRADPKLMSQKEEDQTPLGMCDVQRLFAFAANGVGPNLVRPALAEGLAKAGRFEGAINTITAVFGPRKVTGGDYIRAVQWRRDCKCWKVVDREPKPGH